MEVDSEDSLSVFLLQYMKCQCDSSLHNLGQSLLNIYWIIVKGSEKYDVSP